jgi:protein TonB
LQILPPYPPLALEQGLSGTTLLSVFIGVSGVPEKVEVRNSSGVAEFDHAATQAVFKWQFSPATQAGVAVASWLDIPVRFEVN